MPISSTQGETPETAKKARPKDYSRQSSTLSGSGRNAFHIDGCNRLTGFGRAGQSPIPAVPLYLRRAILIIRVSSTELTHEMQQGIKTEPPRTAGRNQAGGGCLGDKQNVRSNEERF
jgi:hypothetical protein